jgi:hypothetical protein
MIVYVNCSWLCMWIIISSVEVFFFLSLTQVLILFLIERVNNLTCKRLEKRTNIIYFIFNLFKRLKNQKITYKLTSELDAYFHLNHFWLRERSSATGIARCFNMFSKVDKIITPFFLLRRSKRRQKGFHMAMALSLVTSTVFLIDRLF